MQVKLQWITPDAEKQMIYNARVSSTYQDNPAYVKLLQRSIRVGHWSVFEQADACFEIVTSRAMGRQLLRHKSCEFQEFSQRYAEVNTFEAVEPRRQATKNRQSSVDDLPEPIKMAFHAGADHVLSVVNTFYQWCLENDVAKECARFYLPECATSKLYMKGSMRSWMHFLRVRMREDTQQEHRSIANEIYRILHQELPVMMAAYDRWIALEDAALALQTLLGEDAFLQLASMATKNPQCAQELRELIVF